MIIGIPKLLILEVQIYFTYLNNKLFLL